MIAISMVRPIIDANLNRFYNAIQYGYELLRFIYMLRSILEIGHSPIRAFSVPNELMKA